MSYRDWYVGMKVVCISEAGFDSVFGEVFPSIGRVYTLREIFVVHLRQTVVAVRLKEIQNKEFPYHQGLLEPCFSADNFRRVEPRKTDISVFTAMLTGAKERERA